MPDIGMPDATLARFVLERGIAAIYLVAFLVAFRQFPALCGEHGLEPAPRFLRLVPRFLDAPTIFRWTPYTDAKLRAMSIAGMVISAVLLIGLPQGSALPLDLGLVATMACWAVLWALYQSIVNIGGTFYGFGWETLLLEADRLGPEEDRQEARMSPGLPLDPAGAPRNRRLVGAPADRRVRWARAPSRRGFRVTRATGGDQFDAVVVGSGPNGLAAAITLASEGQRVRVLEASDEIGGGARSSTSVLPGYVVDTCSAIHPFGRISPFFASIGLEREGLQWIEPPVALAHPLDDGPAILVTRDVDATARQLGRDRDAYRRLLSPLTTHFDELLPEVLAPFHVPTRSPGAMAALASFGLRAIQPATALAGRFRDERARALLAGAAAHSVLRLDEVVSGAAALLMLGSAHRDGWPFPEGGAGSITRAMAMRLAELGGSVETGRFVRSLDDLPAARVSLFDTSPGQLAAITGSRLSGRYRRALGRYRYGPAVFKLDIAIAGRIPWQDEAVNLAGTVHLGGTFEEIAASERAATEGRISPHPFVLLAQQSLFDRSRAPEGRNVVWAYCHAPNGTTVDMTDAILDQVERFAPGFRDRILAVSKTTPADLTARNPNILGGDMTGGRMSLGQLFTRPGGLATVLDPYATPDHRTFIVSSSTPPGGGVHGMCGWHGAQSALRRLA